MTDLLIRGAVLLDGTEADPVPGMDVRVRDGKIAAIGQRLPVPKRGVSVIDADGLTLMPGLTDAHVHFAMIGRNGSHGSEPWVSHVLIVKEIIERALQEGFTTVRDAGGLEPAYAHAVARGQIKGPRILPSGGVLSQTGGHGDLRDHHEQVHKLSSIAGLVAAQAVVDGVDAVRWAAREQLRRGATQIKMFASGGILSPTDPFDSLQFTSEEIAAAVGVARDWHTYVLAHSHTSEATTRCIEAGVRSIEHGLITDEATARRIAAADAFVVPTLLVGDELIAMGENGDITAEQLEKLRAIWPWVTSSVANLQDAKVKIGSGSDIVGPEQSRRAREIVLKARLVGARDAIASATRVNAELFGLADRIGTIETGKDADLILVDGRPLEDVAVLADPDRIRLVARGGEIMKDLDQRVMP